MKRVRILVFPCGSEVALEIHRALKDISFVELLGGSSVEDHGRFVFQNYIGGIPFVTAPNFIERFNAVLEQEQVDFIYPAMDQVIDVLAAQRDELKAELIAPCADAVHICRSKLRTYERLKGLPFVPQTYQTLEEVEQFPVVVKPAEGYGSKGVAVLKTREELERTLAKSSEPNVICEYLAGEEYTVDCFSDRYGRLKYVSYRNRGRIRNGISVNSAIQPNDRKINEIAQQIVGRIAMRGAWFFQVKCNKTGEYKLLECATRVAGTMCVERAVGVNLPLLSVFDAMGYDVEVERQFESAEVDRALYNTYRLPQNFSEVYLDFDDTVTVHGKVNCTLIGYLYQCVNKGIPIHLVSKHEGDLLADLRALRISAELFESIIHIDRTQKKCDVVTPKPDALFIDDSFVERKEMRKAFGIVTLGVESVEALIDHRQ